MYFYRDTTSPTSGWSLSKASVIWDSTYDAAKATLFGRYIRQLLGQEICRHLSQGAILYEWAGVPLMFLARALNMRRAQIILVLGGIKMHTGILAMLRIFPFPAVMDAFHLMFWASRRPKSPEASQKNSRAYNIATSAIFFYLLQQNLGDWKLIPKFDNGDIGEALRIPQNWCMYSPTTPTNYVLPIATAIVATTATTTATATTTIDATRLLADGFPAAAADNDFDAFKFTEFDGEEELPVELQSAYNIFRSIRWENNFSSAWREPVEENWEGSGRRNSVRIICNEFESAYGVELESVQLMTYGRGGGGGNRGKRGQVFGSGC